jgi:dihydroxyacetone kinase-like protein
MDQSTQQVDVGTLLGAIASVLQQNQASINQTDNAGTHGQRMAQAFQAAARAASRTRTDDAGEQLEIAAQAMRQAARGKAVGYYANGLEEAATEFRGQSGISLDSLAPFLQSFLGGVQQGNPAQPGQGTMIDALLPAVMAFLAARQSGADPTQAAIQALTSAMSGARSTAGPSGQMDPGAASATNVLGGIIGAFLPGVLGAASQGTGTPVRGQQKSGRGYTEQPADPLGGLGGIISALGGLAGQGGYAEQDQTGGSGWPSA